MQNQDFMYKKANSQAFENINKRRNKRFWFTIKIIVTAIIILALFLFLKKQGI